MSKIGESNQGMEFLSSLDAKPGSNIGGIRRSTRFIAECFDQEGVLKWSETFHNLVVDEGLDDSLNQYFKGNSYTGVFYIGITASGPTAAAGDTLTSHAGWAEEQDYSEASRPTLVLASASSQVVHNGDNRAAFTISSAVTIGGAFVCTGASANVKGGTTGKLYGIGAFTAGDRPLISSDTLNVRVDFISSAT